SRTPARAGTRRPRRTARRAHSRHRTRPSVRAIDRRSVRRVSGSRRRPPLERGLGAAQNVRPNPNRPKPMRRPDVYTGPAIFSYGFRPFFFFGSIYAAVAVMAWLPAFHGHYELVTAFAPRDWHIHEMLFGYVAAVVAGFLTTAIPNW